MYHLQIEMEIDVAEIGEIVSLAIKDSSLGQITHQCKSQGPLLSVTNRMVTLSPGVPVETTSLRIGFA